MATCKPRVALFNAGRRNDDLFLSTRVTVFLGLFARRDA